MDASHPQIVHVGDATTFNLTEMANGNEVYITVVAVDRAGNSSAPSSELVRTPSEVAPDLLSQIGGPLNRVWLHPIDNVDKRALKGVDRRKGVVDS